MSGFLPVGTWGAILPTGPDSGVTLRRQEFEGSFVTIHFSAR